MLAADELIHRLRQLMIEGTLPAREPLFVLRAQDRLAPKVVAYWCQLAEEAGVPPEKVSEARSLLAKMEQWPVTQIPGRFDTRTYPKPADPDPTDC